MSVPADEINSPPSSDAILYPYLSKAAMRDFQTIQSQTYDLIIIGGGINGAGIARDAALRGLKTILIEKGDFGSGTTSVPTRLVHGGLRYLEYFEFALVRESLREREILLRIAPHLVKPLMLTIPIYDRGSRPYWQIQAGMILYDVFSFDKTLLPHRMLPKRKFKQLFRQINSKGLQGGAQYYDAQVAYAERLCLENAIAAQLSGATVLNYVAVTQLERQGNRIARVVCQDCLTNETFVIQGNAQAVVLNTTGPWVDRVCQSGMRNDSPAPIGKTPKIGGTKGSHLMVDPFPGAPETALYVEARQDGRPFFIVPWLGMYLIGTTDIHFQGDLDRCKASDAEIDYLLTETNDIIPTAQLTREDVKFTYSGVRPLPDRDGKDPGSITRKHILYDHSSEGAANLISLIGGKLTTYRHVGEEMVDVVYQKQGRLPPPCMTEEKPLPGAIAPNDLRIQQAVRDYGAVGSPGGQTITPATIHYLFSLYGARALEVLALVDQYPDLAAPITAGLCDIKAQVVYAVRSEFAHTLIDIIHRRTTLSMHHRYGLPLLQAVNEVLIEFCGWDRARCDRNNKQYQLYMEENCIPDYVLKAEMQKEEMPQLKS